RLEEVDALESVTTLERIDLTGCINLQNVEGLRALANLEDVTLPSSRGGWNRVYNRKELTELQATLTARHATRQAMERGDPTTVKVRELLIHGDLHHQMQALEVMRSFGPEFAEAVLVDCYLNENGDIIVPFGEPSESVLIALVEMGRISRPVKQLRLYGDLFGKLNVLKHLPDLEILELQDMKQLISLSGIEHCQRLHTLKIDNAPRLFDISSLRRARSLVRLEIGGRSRRQGMSLAPAINTAALRSLETLVYLQELDVTGCGAIELDVVGQMKGLRTMKVSGILPPHGLSRIAHLHRLEEIEIRNCQQLEDLHPIRQMPKLKRLILENCRDLRELRPFMDAPLLDALQIGGENIIDAAPLAGQTALTYLALQNMHALASLDFVSGMTGLETLYIGGAQPETLQSLSTLTALSDLTVQMMPKLRTLDGLERCTALETLRIEGGCDALAYTEALLEMNALTSLRLQPTEALQVPPKRPQDVNLNAYRGQLRAQLNHKQKVTRSALHSALDDKDHEAVGRELADLRAFQDPRLVVALLADLRVAGGRPVGGLLSGSPLAHHALVETLRVGVSLSVERCRALAASLTEALEMPDGSSVSPQAVQGGRRNK
ncbi:MAG: hypothetical protein AAFV53_34095, partial [Myxococcota bacterium]